MYDNDIIAQIITGKGPSAVSVIRISGPGSFLLLKKIFRGAPDLENAASHTAHYGHIVDGGKIIDEVIVTVMRAPRTFTAEDTAEISCHGGLLTTAGCLRAAVNNGARPAEPGEFTKRAFMNGRIDLSQAEAVAELICAKTAAARDASLKQLSGSLKNAVSELREETVALLAGIEASIDFPEHDLAEINSETVKTKTAMILKKIGSLLDAAERGRVVTRGINTVIAGKPNAGKSSLFNAMLGGERAIVTEIPGTTRDVISDGIDAGGLYLNISDTAGIGNPGARDPVEIIGAGRAEDSVRSAELVLFVLDGSRPADAADYKIAEMLSGKKTVAVINKADLPRVLGTDDAARLTDAPVVRVSAKEGTGLAELYDEIKKTCLGGVFETDGGEHAAVCGERHAYCLNRAREAYERALEAAEAGLAEDFISIDLAEGLAALGEITGESAGDDVIDKIFSQFCLGK